MSNIRSNFWQHSIMARNILLITFIGIHLPIAKLQIPWPENIYKNFTVDSTDSSLYRVLEQALLNRTYNMYNLQKVFFNPDGTSPTRVKINITTTVRNIKFNPLWTPFKPGNIVCDINLTASDYLAQGTIGPGFFHNNCTAPWPNEHGFLQTCNYNSPCQDCWMRPNYHNYYSGNSTSTDTFIWADSTNRLGTISDLLTNKGVLRILRSIDFVALTLFTEMSSSFDHYFYFKQPIQLKLLLNISELDFMPCSKDVVETMKVLLVWAKAYARNGGRTIEKSESDRGQTWTEDSDWFGDNYATYGGYSAGAIRNMIVSIFFILNFLTLLFAYFFLEKITQYFLSNPNDHMVCHVYWSLSIFVGLFNMILLGCNCSYYLSIFAESPSVDLIPVLRTKVISVIMMLVFEPVIAWQASKSVKVPVNNAVLVLNVLIYTLPFCVCCIPCCVTYVLKHCCSRWYCRLLHTIVLCNILWFIHELVSTSSVVAFMVVSNPPVMVTTLTLMIFLFVCVLLMIYTIMFRVIRRPAKCSCNYILKIFFHTIFSLIAWIGIMILLVFFTLIYFVFLDYGLNYSTAVGFILSAIPPMMVFVLTLYFKKCFTNRELEKAVVPNHHDSINTQTPDQNHTTGP